MPFHVELSAGINHARAFNLSREQLLSQVVAPWLEDLAIELGEREWQPAESELKILEGPQLDGPDLSFGQGWANAQRSSENVTKRELAAAPAPARPDAFVIESDEPEQTVAELIGERETKPVTWNEARARIDRRDPTIAAMILVIRREP